MQEMIVKSSFSKGTGKGTASLNYISREGALEGGRASVYDREGIILHRDQFKELKQEIKEAEMERRLIFSPAEPDLSKEEISTLVRDVIERYQVEEDKNFDYVYAIHDHNERTHVHVLAWGDKEDLRMDKDDLASIRERALDLEIEQEQIIELAIGKEEVHEKDNSAELEIDYEIPVEDHS
jgi:hypothetical protein